MLTKYKASILQLVTEEIYNSLNDAFNGVVFNYRLKKYDESSKHIGQFIENACRLLQKKTIKKVTPLAKKIEVSDELDKIMKGSYPKPFGGLLPQGLRHLQVVRSQQDVIHTNVDHNKYIIASLCFYNIIWYLYTFLKHVGVSDSDLNYLYSVEVKDTPLTMTTCGSRKTYNPTLPKREQVLILLYDSNDTQNKLSVAELKESTDYANITNFKNRILKKLHSERLIHYDEDSKECTITTRGISEIEKILKDV